MPLEERRCSGTAARGGGGAPSPGGVRGCGDVALGEVVSGHGGVGLDLGIIELFSNLNDSITLNTPTWDPAMPYLDREGESHEAEAAEVHVDGVEDGPDEVVTGWRRGGSGGR